MPSCSAGTEIPLIMTDENSPLPTLDSDAAAGDGRRCTGRCEAVRRWGSAADGTVLHLAGCDNIPRCE